MDKQNMAREILAEFNNDEEWDERHKIGSVALVLMALEIVPSEDEWRDFLLISGINIFDSQSNDACVDASNFYYYSGLMQFDGLAEDSWIDSRHPQAFNAVVDEEFAERVMMLRNELMAMKNIA